MVRFCIRIQI